MVLDKKRNVEKPFETRMAPSASAKEEGGGAWALVQTTPQLLCGCVAVTNDGLFRRFRTRELVDDVGR